MFRLTQPHFLTSLAFAASLTLTASLPATAQQIDAADCDTFGEIAQAATTARLDGKRARAATRQISRSYTGDTERFKGSVPLLVDFVYSLPEGQLDENVGTVYAEACRAQAS